MLELCPQGCTVIIYTMARAESHTRRSVSVRGPSDDLLFAARAHYCLLTSSYYLPVEYSDASTTGSLWIPWCVFCRLRCLLSDCGLSLMPRFARITGMLLCCASVIAITLRSGPVGFPLASFTLNDGLFSGATKGPSKLSRSSKRVVTLLVASIDS